MCVTSNVVWPRNGCYSVQRRKVLHVLGISSFLLSYLRFPGNYLLFVFSQVKNPVLWESAGLSNRSFLNTCIKKEGQSTCALKWGKGMSRHVLKLPPKSLLCLFQYAEDGWWKFQTSGLKCDSKCPFQLVQSYLQI